MARETPADGRWSSSGGRRQQARRRRTALGLTRRTWRTGEPAPSATGVPGHLAGAPTPNTTGALLAAELGARTVSRSKRAPHLLGDPRSSHLEPTTKSSSTPPLTIGRPPSAGRTAACSPNAGVPSSQRQPMGSAALRLARHGSRERLAVTDPADPDAAAVRDGIDTRQSSPRSGSAPGVPSYRRRPAGQLDRSSRAFAHRPRGVPCGPSRPAGAGRSRGLAAGGRQPGQLARVDGAPAHGG